MASRLRRPRPKPGGNENRSCEAPADQSAKGVTSIRRTPTSRKFSRPSVSRRSKLRAGPGCCWFRYDKKNQSNSYGITYTNEWHIPCHPEIPPVKRQIRVNSATPVSIAIKIHPKGDRLGDTSEREITLRSELVGITRWDYLG